MSPAKELEKTPHRTNVAIDAKMAVTEAKSQGLNRSDRKPKVNPLAAEKPKTYEVII